MFLEKFMNTNSDWQTRLAVSPYYIETKQEGKYYILNYNMSMSDFERPEVIEARGSIFRQEENGEWKCVCRALDKFGNYGESYAATPRIDWSKGVDVQEKIDGSIIKIWYDLDQWHISTNGAVDAFKVTCLFTNFGDLFLQILGLEEIGRLDEFFARGNCYWFELVSPVHNHIVVRYPEDRVYFLGARSLVTMEELDGPFQFGKLDEVLWKPRHFTYFSLKECIEAAHQMGEDEEGYVCVSTIREHGSHLRIKVKGDEYLALHKLRGSGALTVLRIMEMWQDGTLDDFVAYYSEYKGFVDEIVKHIREIIDASDRAFETVSQYPDIHDRKDFAKYANTYKFPVKNFLFSRLDNQVPNASMFYKKMRTRHLTNYITGIIGQKQIGVLEDE